jgi:hypothetical protein
VKGVGEDESRQDYHGKYVLVDNGDFREELLIIATK